MSETKQAVAVAATPTDRMAIVAEELKKLQKIADATPVTKDKTILGINIITETNLTRLIRLRSTIKNMAKCYDEEVGLVMQEGLIQSAELFTESGVSVEGIVADINWRIQILNTEDRRNKLNAIMEGYKKEISREDRLNMLDKQLAELTGQ